MSQALPAPFVGLQTDIKPEWIDFNGHFNAGYYMVVFDDAIGPWMRFVGLDDEHRATHNVSTFTVEGHITYDREVAQGEPIEVRTQLLGFSGHGRARVPANAPRNRGMAGGHQRGDVAAHLN